MVPWWPVKVGGRRLVDSGIEGCRIVRDNVQNLAGGDGGGGSGGVDSGVGGGVGSIVVE